MRRVLNPWGQVTLCNIFLCLSLFPPKRTVYILLFSFYFVFPHYVFPFYSILRPQFASISSTHYPPPVLVKHPIWYLDHADLFISVWGTLYGVHWAYFNNSSYFHAIMDILGSLFIIPRGYLPQGPIPSDNLDEMLHQLISYLYKPTEFSNIRSAWESLKQISVGWYMPQITATAVWKLINNQYQNMPLLQCMMLQHFTTHTVAGQQRMMWQHWHKHPSTRDGSNDIDLIKDD